jgi:hypothetical protein
VPGQKPSTELEGFDWLVLDPTPDTEAPPEPAFSLRHWWDEGIESGQEFWQRLIVGYNAVQQRELKSELLSARILLRLGSGALTLLALAGLVWLARRVRNRRARPASALTLYTRLCRLLAPLGLRPAATQTAREFAALAGQELAFRGQAALVDLPARVVELYYRMRFGGWPLEEEERRTVEAQLDVLAESLPVVKRKR